MYKRQVVSSFDAFAFIQTGSLEIYDDFIGCLLPVPQPYPQQQVARNFIDLMMWMMSDTQPSMISSFGSNFQFKLERCV